jgi:uncharacterized membrane protein (UPF0127 family)
MYSGQFCIPAREQIHQMVRTDTPHVLDLVFTNEENMVSEMEYLSSIGKSDHCDSQFQFNCYVKLKIDRRQKCAMIKGTMQSLIRR